MHKIVILEMPLAIEDVMGGVTYIMRYTWNLMGPYRVIADRMMRVRFLNEMVKQAEILHSESGFC